MSDELKVYEWNPLTARRPRRVGMFRSLSYIEMSVGIAVASIVVWFSTGNVEVFLTVFGFAYLLAVAHSWNQSRENCRDARSREFTDVMSKIYDLEDKCEKCLESKCVDSQCKTSITNKADF
jgi:hypothetical protein